MTERKFTDEDVIRALEHCAKSNTTEPYCNDCPYETTVYCSSAISRDTLDFIKRQRAEIADLKDENAGLKEANDHLSGEYIALSKEKDNLIRTYAECQAEAIKEFTEKLKQKASMTFICNHRDGTKEITGYQFSPTTIDNLVKEMTESAI